MSESVLVSVSVPMIESISESVSEPVYVLLWLSLSSRFIKSIAKFYELSDPGSKSTDRYCREDSKSITGRTSLMPQSH